MRLTVLWPGDILRVREPIRMVGVSLYGLRLATDEERERLYARVSDGRWVELRSLPRQLVEEVLSDLMAPRERAPSAHRGRLAPPTEAAA